MTTTINGRGVGLPIPTLPSERAGNPVECLRGAILWLPPKSQIPWTLDSGLPSGCYDHPVAILSAPKGGNVDILTLTSFDEKSLATAHPHSREIRSHYLPIAPSEPHPDNRHLLHLDSQCKRPLRKKSYIDASCSHMVSMAALRHYDRHAGARTCDYVLRRDSFESLVIYFSELRAKCIIPGAFISNGGTFVTSPPLDVHHPTATTPVLSSNSYQTFVSPLVSERSSLLGNPRSGGVVCTQAMTMARSAGQATQTWNNYGTNTPARPSPWSSDPEWRRQHRTPQSLNTHSLPKEGHKVYLLLLVILVFIVGVLISAAIYGLAIRVYSLGMWFWGILKDVVHFAEGVWIVVRDIVIGWIEALRRHQW